MNANERIAIFELYTRARDAWAAATEGTGQWSEAFAADQAVRDAILRNSALTTPAPRLTK